MVDDDEVAVALLPAAVDDRAAGRRVDRRPVRRRRCRSPRACGPTASRTGSSPAPGPARSARRSTASASAPVFRACAARIWAAMRALAAWSASISAASWRSASVSVDRSWSFFCFVDDEVVARADELVAHRPRLIRPRPDHRGLGVHRRREASSSSCAPPCTSAFARDTADDDRAILRVDVFQRLDVVDRVLDAARSEEDVERRRVVGLVDVDEPPVQHVERLAVLRAQRREPVRSARGRASSARRAASGAARDPPRASAAEATRRRRATRAARIRDV